MTQAKPSYKGYGKQDAEGILSALNKVNGRAKDVLVKRAIEFAANAETIKDYLEGFGEVMGQTRKSEAKAVFDAFGVNAEIATAKAQEIQDYASFITECREIRGVQSRAPAARAIKVTDKQVSEIMAKIPAMKAETAEKVVKAAMLQLVETAKDQWELAILVQIQSLSEKLRSSEQPIYSKAAQTIYKVAADMIDADNAEKAKQEVGKHQTASEQDATTAEIKALMHGVPFIPESAAQQHAVAA